MKVLVALKAAGLSMPELVIDNGAGLSRDTRISARSLGRLLLAAAGSPFRSEFEASLSIAGLDGTTRRRFRRDAMAGRMHLKTGTLNGVTAIAGFVRSESGREYAVVAITNRSPPRTAPGSTPSRHCCAGCTGADQRFAGTTSAAISGC